MWQFQELSFIFILSPFLSLCLCHSLSLCCCSVAKSCPTLCDPMVCRLSCLSPSPGACSNSCPLSWWCHPTISSSVIPAWPNHLSSLKAESFSSSSQKRKWEIGNWKGFNAHLLTGRWRRSWGKECGQLVETESSLWPKSQQRNGELSPTTVGNWILPIIWMSLEVDSSLEFTDKSSTRLMH